MIGIFFGACSKDYMFKEYKDIATTGWAYEQPLSFEFEIKDSSKVYELMLDVVHADTFAFENAYVKVFTEFPNGTKTEQQLSLELAAKNGIWNGKCSSGVCDVMISLQQAVVFAQLGKYKVTFEQYGRNPVLKGISKIGLLIENIDRTKKSSPDQLKKKSTQPMPIKKF